MSINNARINVILSAEQVAAISTAMAALNAALPFLVSLTVEERRRLFKLGSRSEGFVREAASAAREYPEHLPSSLGLEALDRDLALRETLLPILQQVRTLYTKVNDTWMVAGADAMQTATAMYRVLKAHRGEGLDETIRVLKQRFERSGASNPASTPGESDPVVG